MKMDMDMDVNIKKNYPSYVRGREIKAEDIEEGRVSYNLHKPNIIYSFTAGQAISKFLNGLKEGKLLATECHSCNRTLFPPRIFCEVCFRPIDKWCEVKDSGVVETFSISYIDPDAKPLEKPIIVAVISIDGASPKMGIMHILGEVEPEDVYIGMRVRAVWKPESEREGSITDIMYWKPAEGD